MKLLNDKDKCDIAEAVKQAESSTSGEIATAIISESDSYHGFELSATLFIGALTFLVMLLRLPALESILSSSIWNYSSFHLVLTIGCTLFLVLIITYLLINIPAVNRLVVPKKEQESKVRQRALVHFMEAGVTETKERTGILIFISTRERRIELIADSGIDAVIDSSTWSEVVELILEGIKSNQVKDGIISAVTKCGKLLSEKFPSNEENPNELNDSIVELEK